MTFLTARSTKKRIATDKLLSSALSAILALSVPATAVLSQSAVAATAADNLTAAKRLNTLLSNVKSMNASFTQTTKGASSGGLNARNGAFSGVMSVQRPNNFRWETKTPSEQLVIGNSNSLWVYDKDLEQVTRQNADSQVGNTPALLLSGSPNKIASNFKITQPNAKLNYYVLYPKAVNSNFKSLAISFNAGKPAMMVLNDSLGQTTSIKFKNVRINQKMSSSQFDFTPPKGVDVINQ